MHNKYQNPADFLVKSLAIVPGNETKTAEQASDICKQFENSIYAKDIYKYIENEIQNQVSYMYTFFIKLTNYFYFFIIF